MQYWWAKLKGFLATTMLTFFLCHDSLCMQWMVNKCTMKTIVLSFDIGHQKQSLFAGPCISHQRSSLLGRLQLVDSWSGWLLAFWLKLSSLYHSPMSSLEGCQSFNSPVFPSRLFSTTHWHVSVVFVRLNCSEGQSTWAAPRSRISFPFFSLPVPAHL